MDSQFYDNRQSFPEIDPVTGELRYPGTNQYVNQQTANTGAPYAQQYPYQQNRGGYAPQTYQNAPYSGQVPPAQQGYGVSAAGQNYQPAPQPYPSGQRYNVPAPSVPAYQQGQTPAPAYPSAGYQQTVSGNSYQQAYDAARINAMNEENSRLRLELEELRRQREKDEKDLEENRNAAEKARIEADSYRKELDTALQKAEEARRQSESELIATREEAEKKQQEVLAQLRMQQAAQNNELQQKMAEARNSMEQLWQQSQEERQRIEEERRQLEETKNQVSDMQMSFEAEKDRITAEKNMITAEKDRIVAARQQLDQDLASSEEIRKKLEEEKNSLDAARLKAEQDRNAFEASRQVFDQNLQKFNSDRNALDQSMQRLARERNLFDETVQRFNLNVDEFEKQRAATEQSRAELEQDRAALEQNRAVLEQHIQRFNDDRSEFERQKEETERDRVRLAEERLAAEQLRRQLDEDRIALEASKQQSIDELAARERLIAETEKQNQVQRANVDETRMKDAESLRAFFEAKREEAENMRLELDKEKAEFELQKQQLMQNAEEELRKIEEERELLRNQQAELEKKMAEAAAPSRAGNVIENQTKSPDQESPFSTLFGKPESQERIVIENEGNDFTVVPDTMSAPDISPEDSFDFFGFDYPTVIAEGPAPAGTAAEEPVAEEPAVTEPVAEEPVVEEPAVTEPVAEEPVAEEPAVTEPVAEEPVVEEPVVTEPVAEEPVVEEPAVTEPVTEEPAVEEPVVTEPVAEEPAVEEPVVTEPVAEEPAVEEPAVTEPVAEEPAVEEPVVTEPVVEEPAVEEPAVTEPVAEEPVVVEIAATEPEDEHPMVEETISAEPVPAEPMIDQPVADEDTGADTETEIPGSTEDTGNIYVPSEEQDSFKAIDSLSDLIGNDEEDENEDQSFSDLLNQFSTQLDLSDLSGSLDETEDTDFTGFSIIDIDEDLSLSDELPGNDFEDLTKEISSAADFGKLTIDEPDTFVPAEEPAAAPVQETGTADEQPAVEEAAAVWTPEPIPDETPAEEPREEERFVIFDDLPDLTTAEEKTEEAEITDDAEGDFSFPQIEDFSPVLEARREREEAVSVDTESFPLTPENIVEASEEEKHTEASGVPAEEVDLQDTEQPLFFEVKDDIDWEENLRSELGLLQTEPMPEEVINETAGLKVDQVVIPAEAETAPEETVLPEEEVAEPEEITFPEEEQPGYEETVRVSEPIRNDEEDIFDFDSAVDGLAAAAVLKDNAWLYSANNLAAVGEEVLQVSNLTSKYYVNEVDCSYPSYKEVTFGFPVGSCTAVISSVPFCSYAFVRAIACPEEIADGTVMLGTRRLTHNDLIYIGSDRLVEKKRQTLDWLMSTIGGNAEQKRAKLIPLLEQVGMSGLAGTEIDSLTYSQRMLILLIAVSFSSTPIILINDPKFEIEEADVNSACGVFKLLADSGKTVILAGHSPRLMRSVANRVLAIHYGNPVFAGSYRSFIDENCNALILFHSDNAEEIEEVLSSDDRFVIERDRDIIEIQRAENSTAGEQDAIDAARAAGIPVEDLRKGDKGFSIAYKEVFKARPRI